MFDRAAAEEVLWQFEKDRQSADVPEGALTKALDALEGCWVDETQSDAEWVAELIKRLDEAGLVLTVMPR